MTDPITVQVALRIRPLVQSEVLRGCRKCLESIPSENQVQVVGTDKAFTYNFVFDETISQEDFYDTSIKHMVTKLFKGFNVTILAYGQTGSGKTHSMGTCYDGVGEMGVIPRAIIDIYKYIEENCNTFDFRITVSFMELYNETLFDLLSSKSREQNIIEIREDTKGIKMPGLTEQEVTSVEQTLRCLIDGSAGRAVGATAMNAQSSRSHAIFTITVYMAKKTEPDGATTAKFHLVDLAGSERSKKTKATGDRFKEGVNINKGLLALGNVISALGDENSKGYISYRDSKLTRLLQDSLGGNSMTLMIACVSPADYNLDETISTLRYADRARKIRNKPIVNQDPKAAEINRLNQLVNQLRLQLIEGGCGGSSEEITKLKEQNRALQLEKQSLNHALSVVLVERANMLDRQVLTEQANEKLKNKLLELQETCNVTLSNITFTIGDKENEPDIKEHLGKLNGLKEMIEDLQIEHNKNEEERIQHEYQMQVKTPTISSEFNFSESDIHECQERHTKEQLNLNIELQELTRNLAIKEQLASQIISNNNHMLNVDLIADNEKKVSALEKEKEELLLQLKNARSSDTSSKTTEQRHQRVKELENKITELKRKQTSLIKLKEKDDLKIKQLNNEIQAMKANKVKLIRNMKSEETKFRAWKLERERDLIKLKDQDRKRQNQIVKMETMHQKQQHVLKRKMEEAVAVNKRLKDILSRQKSCQEQRRGQNNGKTERIAQYVSQEVELMISTIDAEKGLENLMEDRAVLCAQLEDFKNSSDMSDSVQADEHIKQLTNEIDIRSVQISDLQQKILDSDQENKAKTRWDTIQSMVEAKYALKHLFELIADIGRKSRNVQSAHEDLNSAHKDALEKLTQHDKQIKEMIQVHGKQMSQVVEEYEEKVSLLIKQLRGIEAKSSDESVNERMKIQEEHLAKMDKLEEELENYKLKCSELQDTLSRIQQVSQIKTAPKKKVNKFAEETFIKEELETSIESVQDDSLKEDPDWSKTPMFKKKRRTVREDKENESKDRETVKRSSDGTTRCACKSTCEKKICGCKKLSVFCSDLCKCTNCKNRDDSKMETFVKQEVETDSEDSYKRPRLFSGEDNNTITRPRKYKKSYFTMNDKE